MQMHADLFNYSNPAAEGAIEKKSLTFDAVLSACLRCAALLLKWWQLEGGQKLAYKSISKKSSDWSSPVSIITYISSYILAILKY